MESNTIFLEQKTQHYKDVSYAWINKLSIISVKIHHVSLKVVFKILWIKNLSGE